MLLQLAELHKTGELYSDPNWGRLIGNADLRCHGTTGRAVDQFYVLRLW